MADTKPSAFGAETTFADGDKLPFLDVSEVAATFEKTITAANAAASLASKMTVAGIGDVTITAIASGEILKWNGSAWINNTLAEAGISATTHTHTLTDITDVTITVADLNALDDGADTTLHFHDSDRARANHTGTQLASTISDFDTQVRLSRLDQMAVPTADVSMNSNKITNVLDPTADQDAATKAYVDAVKQGLDIKDSVRVATTANTTLSGEQTIDDVLTSADRVLVKNQTDPSENGIYVSAAGAWSRAGDADVSADVTAGMFVFVEEGTVNGDNGFVLTTNDPITLGTTGLTFVQFSGAGQITAGNGLSKTGNQLDVNVDDSTIEINADALRAKDNGISNAKLSDMVQDRIKGRATVSTGDPEDLTASQVRTMINVEDGATADQSNAEIETAYNAQVAAASQAEAEAGTEAAIRRFSPLRIKQAIDALGASGRPVPTFVVAASDANSTVGADYICDGTADEVQIQAAINALPSSGGSVILSEGTFSCDDNITTIPNNIKIQGQGVGQTIVKISSTFGNVSKGLFQVQHSFTVTMRALNAVTRADETLTLTTGTQEDEFAADDLIKVVSTDQIGDGTNENNGEFHYVRSVTTDDTGVITLYDNVRSSTWTSPTVGVLSDMPTGFTVEGIEFQDERANAPATGQGTIFTFRFRSDIRITNCKFTDIVHMVGKFDNCLRVHVDNCDIFNVKSKETSPTLGSDIRYGFQFAGCAEVTVDNSNFFSMRHAITTEANIASATDYRWGWCENIRVSNCFTSACDAAGLDTHMGVRLFTYCNNTISSSHDAGTDIFALDLRGTNGTVANNTVMGYGTAAKIFGGQTTKDPIVISGNWFDVTRRGILFDDFRGKSIVSGNYINVNSGGGATASGGVVLERDGVAEHGGDELVINNNIIDMNSVANADGIRGNSNIDMIISGNLILNAAAGVDMADTDTRTANIRCHGNTFKNCTDNYVIAGNSDGMIGEEQEIYCPQANDNTSTSDRFKFWGSLTQSVGATEGNLQAKIYKEIVITDFASNAIVVNNGSNCQVAVRDDGVDVAGTVVTITASTPGLYEATGLNVSVAAGSLMGIRSKGAGTTPALRTIETVRYRFA